MTANMPDVSERVCRHCGKKTGITYGTISIGSGLSAVLCHTSDPNRPDCYRRVTVYHESLGILKIADPAPRGVEDIYPAAGQCVLDAIKGGEPASPVSVRKGDTIRIIPEVGPERVMLVSHVEHHIITLADP